MLIVKESEVSGRLNYSTNLTRTKEYKIPEASTIEGELINSDVESEKEIDNSKNAEVQDNVVDSIEVRALKSMGRREGDTEVPDFLREVMAVNARFQSSSSVADAFGVSQPSVSNYARGEIGKRKDESLVNRVNEQLGKIRDEAVGKLMMSLGLLTESKIGREDAPTISKIAKDMTEIVSKTMPAEMQGHGEGGAKIVIYAPQLKKEENYNTINL